MAFSGSSNILGASSSNIDFTADFFSAFFFVLVFLTTFSPPAASAVCEMETSMSSDCVVTIEYYHLCLFVITVKSIAKLRYCILHCILLYFIVLYCTILYCIILKCIVFNSTVLYSTCKARNWDYPSLG